MKVGVNLCWLVPGVVGGSEEATTRALHALADRMPSDLEVVLFGLRALRGAQPELVRRFETHTLPIPGRLKPVRVLAEHTWLRAMVAAHRIDLLHDAGGTSPGRMRARRVVTIHDLQPLEIPGNFNPVRVAYLRRTVPRAAAGADRILVPSEFVRGRVAERLGTDPDRIDVVPWSVPRPTESTPIETVRARYGIIGKIVLLPAITYPHKDHVVAIRAMDHIAERHPETTLVLTGGVGPAEQAVLDEIERLDVGHRVVRTERTSGAVIASLFEHAEVVLFPSRYEGFGIPALEAMDAGVPVIVADAGALPEVVGDAGVVIPPGDDVQLAVELHRILSDPERRATLSAAGRARAAEFSPQRTADAMVAAYRSAMVDL